LMGCAAQPGRFTRGHLTRSTAQRFSGVLGMFSSLGVKVLYPT